MLPPDDVVSRIAATLRAEIGPAVDAEFPRTQAFMASVILERVARQLRAAEDHAGAERQELRELVADLDGLLGAGAPPAVATAIDCCRDGGNEALCALVEALYGTRTELGPSFDAALGRVRRTMRAGLDRALTYAS